MDLSKYGGATKLINKILETVHNPNSHVFSRLRDLEVIAKGAEDNELLGFVYYHYALAYYTRRKHKELLQYLKLAISHLVRQEDKDILVAAYNVFAAEAKTNGCFEVALDYYLTAHYLIEDEKDLLAYALTGANIADLLAQMGEFKKAYGYTKFIRQAISILEKGKDQVVNLASIATFHVNLGLIALNSNKYEEALREAEELEKIDIAAIGDMGETLELYYLIFKLRLAIEANEKDNIESLAEKIEDRISCGLIISELVQEILDTITELIKHEELGAADHLLRTLDNNTEMNSYAMMLCAQSKIQYYNAIGDEEKSMECCEERSRYMREHLETQNFIYYESITLMEMLEELRREEEKLRIDNIEMQKRAETDSLTGIPNRYAMDRHLDYYFSEAKRHQVRLGIGIVDIDYFKKFNDTYGHIQGDNCLVEVAKAIEAVAEKHGLFAARYGGDEFVLIYYDMENKDIRLIEKEIMNATSVSITHGFCNYIPEVESKIYDYLSKADRELYRNKKANGEKDTWT